MQRTGPELRWADASRLWWRGWLCAVALILPGGEVSANTLDLPGNARLSWEVAAIADPASLSLLVPPYVTWSPGRFREPLQISFATNYAAFVDQWDISFYRAGDTERRAVLARLRGGLRSIGHPLEWDGRVENGPAPAVPASASSRF